MANTMDFEQIATVLNAITEQATGQSSIAPVDTSSFVSVAQTALLTGYDKLSTAISQVISRTIFSVRPYGRRFAGLEADAVRYGNHVRKLQMVDGTWMEDDRLKLVNGQSVDQQVVIKPDVLQTNYYGANVRQYGITQYRDQLDQAFAGPDEFAQFVAMMMTNVSDIRNQSMDILARSTLSNFLAGKIAGDSGNVRHMVSEYNAYAGTNLTSQTVKQPANWGDFVRWLVGQLMTMSDALEERTTLYHINITGKPVKRHTPKRDQTLYLYSPDLNQMFTQVYASTFNDTYLKIMDYERLTFWQDPQTPDTINVKPVYIDDSGEVVNASTAIEQSNVLGVLFDREAVGYTLVNEWSAPAPFNARGGYTTFWWHWTERYWNDFSENGIVLLLD